MKTTLPVVLDEILNDIVSFEDIVLRSLIRELDNRTDAILFLNFIVDLTIPYISKTFELKTGYTANEVIIKGPEFLFSISDPDTLSVMVERQAAYNKMAKVPSFDPSEIVVQEYPVKLIAQSGKSVSLQGLGVVLQYTDNADMHFGVAVFAEREEKTLGECRALLEQIKKRYTELSNSIVTVQSRRNDVILVHVGSNRMDNTLTTREIDVLKYLAAGLSSKQSAYNMKITENTVETYRKSLLRKFQAKNTAELIKKASKVFWLE